MSPADDSSHSEILKDIDNLRERLGKLEIDTAAIGDDRFPGNTYKKALEVVVTEDVYRRLRNIVWTLSILASLGILVLAKNYISTEVRTTIRDQHETFIELENRIAHERLAFHLEQLASGRSPEVIATIKEEYKTFHSHLVKMIGDLNREHEVALASNYATTVEDPELLREMLKACGNPAAAPKIRQRLLEGILRFPRDEVLPDLVNLAYKEDTNAGTLKEQLMMALGRMELENLKVDELMTNALLHSETPDVVSAAFTFFVINPRSPGAAYLASDPGIVARYERFLSLVRLNKKKELTKADEEEVMRQLYSSVDSSYRSEWLLESAQDGSISGDYFGPSLKHRRKSATLGRDNAVAILGHFAFLFAEQGRTLVLQEFLYQGSFDRTIWRKKVLPLFPDLVNSGDAIRGPVERQDVARQQEELRDELEEYVWEKTAGVYDKLNKKEREVRSVRMLQIGDLDGFMELMERDYYEYHRWKTEVLPLFQGFSDELRDDERESAMEELQDSLWHWVIARVEVLRFVKERGFIEG